LSHSGQTLGRTRFNASLVASPMQQATSRTRTTTISDLGPGKTYSETFTKSTAGLEMTENCYARIV
jgi:hypothetical protein